MQSLSEFESLATEIREMKIDLLKIKNRVIASENIAMRLRLKQNAEQKRKNNKDIEKLRREVQGELPF